MLSRALGFAAADLDERELAAEEQLRGQRVEEARPRAEDQVDGGAGDARDLRDLIDADRPGRLGLQPLVERVEDAPPCLLGRLRAQALVVAAGAHRPDPSIRLTCCPLVRHSVR